MDEIKITWDPTRPVGYHPGPVVCANTWPIEGADQGGNWYREVEQEASRELGHGAVLKDLASDRHWERLRKRGLTPTEAVAEVLAEED